MDRHHCTFEIPAWYPLFIVVYVATFLALLEAGTRLMEWWERRRK